MAYAVLHQEGLFNAQEEHIDLSLMPSETLDPPALSLSWHLKTKLLLPPVQSSHYHPASLQTKLTVARDAQIWKLKELTELEDIVKIGHTGENFKVLIGDGRDASSRLLSDYEGLEAARMARTPRTAPQQDNVMMEARNLRNMTIAQMIAQKLVDDELACLLLHDSIVYRTAQPKLYL
ncbi:hypothetical protein CPB84DRAFT_1854091 [Gymnopilus junonius]|uniref:Uncharacterized protein n=1 Tax=Gymnopilus junonius TaxID=109634 RepID=A0A9P5N892_GYMJU|nr:hypothetical protein CPB84DRAFT_1854091 [Gymnopilus junonius]